MQLAERLAHLIDAQKAFEAERVGVDGSLYSFNQHHSKMLLRGVNEEASEFLQELAKGDVAAAKLEAVDMLIFTVSALGRYNVEQEEINDAILYAGGYYGTQSSGYNASDAAYIHFGELIPVDLLEQNSQLDQADILYKTFPLVQEIQELSIRAVIDDKRADDTGRLFYTARILVELGKLFGWLGMDYQAVNDLTRSKMERNHQKYALENFDSTLPVDFGITLSQLLYTLNGTSDAVRQVVLRELTTIQPSSHDS